MRRDRPVLRTILIEGAKPFSIQFPGNPTITHEGGTSVCHQVLLPEEIAFLKAYVESRGNRIISWDVEGQSEEQKLEREMHLSQDQVWPCPQCPSCPWAEVLSEVSPCGLEAWPPESVKVLRETSKPHQEAEEACPVERDSPSLFPFS